MAGQLIEAGAVRPLDVQRITGYTQLSPTLRGAPSELFGCQVYGMPYSWDSYVTGYDAGKVRPAPQSWSSLFEPASAAQYAGKITVPDSPVTLALAALYLKSAQPSLGITDPFELTKPQLAAAAQAVTAVRHNVGTFWTQDSLVMGSSATARMCSARCSATRSWRCARPADGGRAAPTGPQGRVRRSATCCHG